MPNIWECPTSVIVNGHEYPIRTDYRVVIDLLTALNDPECRDEDETVNNYIQTSLILQIMFPEKVAADDIPEALKAIKDFIDMGMEGNDERQKPRLMDWEQDAGLIIPAVNRVMGKEIRAEKYIHWWTFLAAYMEIGECSFSNILHLRIKKSKGKKLEKWEQEYIAENKNLVLLGQKKTEEEKAEEEKLLSIFG